MRLFVLVNITALILSPVAIQRGFSTLTTVVMTVLMLLVMNGALWLGLRLQGSDGPQRPLLLFVLGGLAAADAIVEIFSNEYEPAGLLLLASVAMLGLGSLIMRYMSQKGAR